MRIVVLHRGYGCETGCCGHVIEVDGEEKGQFIFGHPSSSNPEVARKFAEELVRKRFGDEHVKDLVWEECEVYDD